MRIRKIKIDKWRHFEDIEIELDDDAGLVCIVGANGTGKSHILELIAACAHRLGISQGVETPRGDPFSDIHEFSLHFYVAIDLGIAIEDSLRESEAKSEWDRTLIIKSKNAEGDNRTTIEAGGVLDKGVSIDFAKMVINYLSSSKNVHFLSFDANRAYPKANINSNQLAQAYEIDWEGDEYKRGRSFRATITLYDEWIKYFLAQENQSGTRLIKDIRQARQAGVEEPAFSDHFAAYKEALTHVLPHIIFTGVDTRKKTLLFDTTGLELSFDQLSGGEREIAFLIGQIDRFGLRNGLFLLDEPELHLNSDLVRSWVAYLTSTVETGQIWLATHSLEAVEAAGKQATFVLERDFETRKVDTAARLDTRPVLSALSRAVGTPAFSISQLRFAFIEGEESLGERERFRRLAGSPQAVRFMECGSCDEVLRRVTTIRHLADEAEAELRIGGIVDKDFRSDQEIKSIICKGIFVLPVHEVESFFLHPPTIKGLLQQNGFSDLSPEELIQRASDARAGSWIFQHATATSNARTLPGIPTSSKERAKNLSWAEFKENEADAVQGIVALTNFDAEHAKKFVSILTVSTKAYARWRDDDALWKHCEGKQVLNDVARSIGFAGAPALSSAAFAAWDRNPSTVPDELAAFRRYLDDL